MSRIPERCNRRVGERAAGDPIRCMIKRNLQQKDDMNLIGEHCDPRRFLCLPLLFVLGTTCMEAAEGSFDIGLGLGFADAASSDAFEGGWDLQFGYEWHQGQSWNVGTQLHVILGWTSASDVTGGTSPS